jgi:hypothetical protein
MIKNNKQIETSRNVLFRNFGKIVFLLVLAACVNAQESKDSLDYNLIEKSPSVADALKTEPAVPDTQKEISPKIDLTENYKRKGLSFLRKTTIPRIDPQVIVPQDEKEDKNKAGNKAARNEREKWVIPRGATEKGVEVGYGVNIATWLRGPRIYDIRGLRHFLGSVRWGKVLGTKGIVTFSWAIEFIPINVAIRNEVANEKYMIGSSESPTRRENTFGFAVNPASFRFTFFPKLRLRPQLGGGIGITHHFNRVPTTQGTRTNAQWDFQFGAQYMLKQDKAINFGYRYYHISHTKFIPPNPAYNVNVIFVGFSTFKKQ